jgi:hypothetical protein
MRSDLLKTLKAFVEYGIATGEWDTWWTLNASAVEEQLGRFAYLSLSKGGFRSVQDILNREGVLSVPSREHCQGCGTQFFRVIPDRTTEEEVLEFMASLKIHNKGWLHPGEYCPNGCTWRLWNLR